MNKYKISIYTNISKIYWTKSKLDLNKYHQNLVKKLMLKELINDVTEKNILHTYGHDKYNNNIWIVTQKLNNGA